VLSGRGLCDELITRPEESYRLWCVVVYDLETSRIGAPYIYDISNLRVKLKHQLVFSDIYFFMNIFSSLSYAEITFEVCPRIFRYTLYSKIHGVRYQHTVMRTFNAMRIL